MFSVFGGTVDVTGEILHGKTSPLRHDARGVYEGIPQDIAVTRYHSLAGTHVTLPDCLEVSSWIASEDGGKGVIMGVRHKEYVVEGVQFHPESILTEEGRTMLKNFLKMESGTWAENAQMAKSESSSNAVSQDAHTAEQVQTDKTKSILDKIFDRRRELVEAQKQIPSQRMTDLQDAYDLSLSPPQISFPERLRQSPYPLSLMAEIKRASPSKGIISLETCAPVQARIYALAGASVISVLTEPDWFKGSIEDLRAVRQALEGMPNRPAVLRKEFIFDEYQILEARLAGADTILLIVKMLDEETLKRLYHYSQSLGMEPLVEVNTVEEMKIAIKLGSKVIGVNNRNLANFEVDLETTSRLMEGVPAGTIVCALSGIAGPKDVEPYQQNGVGAVLVGEALMRAKDTARFIKELLGGGSAQLSQGEQAPELLVKICGCRTPEAVKAAIEAGADMIGIILVKGRKRCVSRKTALDIANVVRSTPKPKKSSPSITRPAFDRSSSASASEFFVHNTTQSFQRPDRALLVGVFQNQSLDYVLEEQQALGLDIIQFHGNEPVEWANLLPVPSQHKFSPGDAGLGIRGYHGLPLVDAGAGGQGEKVDLEKLRVILQKDAGVMVNLAGGLTSENVQNRLELLKEQAKQVVGVDISSGVEGSDGEQDVEKIRAFVKTAKAIRR